MALFRSLLLLFFVTFVTSSPFYDASNELEYRLPKACVPSNYNMKLTVNPEAFTNASNTFTGQVTVMVEIQENITAIKFHGKNLVIQEIILDHETQDIGKLLYDNDTEIYALPAVLPNGHLAILEIKWEGTLSTEDSFGFYKSSYMEGDEVKYFLATQLKPTYARRVFPCFDEPDFKTNYWFTLTYPATHTALCISEAATEMSNPTDEGDMKTTSFLVAEVMSTYLFGFTIFDFSYTNGSENSINTSIPFNVWSRPDTESSRNFAANWGPQVIHLLNDLTGGGYGGFFKMDVVALPDLAVSAMENFGLVNFREDSLLWDETESSNYDQQRVATAIARELTHMWFGNLVTMEWWSDSFLNEGFGTYFQYSIINGIESWELDKQFVVEVHQAALGADAFESSVALHSEVFTPAEIDSKFDELSINKGGSIIRMVEHLMEQERFQRGLRDLFMDYWNKNINPDDLWTLLGDQLGKNSLPDSLNNIMNSWIYEPGFPLLTVTRTGDTVEISQERFVLPGKVSDTKWWVPITYTTSTKKDFAVTQPEDWLRPDATLTIDVSKDDKWILLNNQQTGYYRVHYEGGLWDTISTALSSDNFDGIDVLSRAQIVDDLFNLAKISKVTYSQALEILKYLQKEIDYYPWYSAFNGFDNILKKIGPDSKLGAAITAFTKGLLEEKLYKTVSDANDGDQIYTLKRALAKTWACRLGNKDCIKEATDAFTAYKKDNTTRPEKNLRASIYCYGLKHGEDSETDWAFLWDRYTVTDIATEKATLLSAMGCTDNEDLLKEYLTKTITPDSGIRPQDGLAVFKTVYSSSPAGLSVAFAFLKENHVAIASTYSEITLGDLLKGLADRFTTQKQVDEFKSFLEGENLNDQFSIAADQALESAEANVKWFDANEKQLDSYFDIKPDSSGTSTNMNISLLVSFVVVLISKLW